MTKRRPFEAFTLASPLGSAVFEKSRLVRYFASSFLNMAARSKSDSTELKVLGSVKVPANRRIEMAPEEKEEGSNVIGLMDALKQSLGRKKSAATAKGKMHAAARRSRKRRAV